MKQPQLYIKHDIEQDWREIGAPTRIELTPEVASFSSIGAGPDAADSLRTLMLNEFKVYLRAVWGENDLRCAGLLMSLGVTPQDEHSFNLELQVHVRTWG